MEARVGIMERALADRQKTDADVASLHTSLSELSVAMGQQQTVQRALTQKFASVVESKVGWTSARLAVRCSERHAGVQTLEKKNQAICG